MMIDAKRDPNVGLPVWRLAMWGVIAAILLAPLVAMQFTREVAWTGFDFAVAGALLIGGGLAFELVVSRVRSARQRMLLGTAILLLVLLIWADGAVGIF